MKWISVKDRLPSENEIVLLYAPGTRSTKGQFHIGRWGPSEGMWMSQDGHAESTRNWFTHWMPLPEPPERDAVKVIINVYGDSREMTLNDFMEFVSDAVRRAIN